MEAEVLQSGKSRKKSLVLFLLVLIVAALLVGYYVWQGGFPGVASAKEYQAVFLSNGQVYFGKASGLQSSFVTLKDVYYLQVQQVLQPVQGQKEPQPVQSVSLAKLGVAELHKPKDSMKINRDHILFIEDLNPDSQVVQAINRYQESLKKPAEKK